jgi:hypothetical protein
MRAAAAAFGLVWCSAAGHAAPTVVPYLGHLTYDAGGVANGEFTVTLQIFSASTGGTSLWGPHTFHDVAVENGLFSILLGGTSSPDLAPALDSGAELWLAFTIDGAALLPRQALLTVPFARRAEHAATAGNAMALGGAAAGAYALSADIPADLATANGSVGTVPLYLGDHELGSSVITQAQGNVGVGVPVPQAALHVAGNVRATSSVRVGGDATTCNAQNAGAIRFQGGVFEGCDGAGWAPFGASAPMFATGGTFTETATHRIHTFTSTGSFSVTAAGTADVLVVAGGGGGAGGNPSSDGNGGGGAGGVRYEVDFPVGVGSYTVTVGNGGLGGAASANSPGQDGGSSSFSTLMALGGGGGGSDSGSQVGRAGGSGGGGGVSTAGGAGGLGTPGQGNKGGDGLPGGGSPGGGGGGGGGVGGLGGQGGQNQPGGAGGSGAQYTITGSAVWYAAGGGGSSWSGHGGDGGSGIGGKGASRPFAYAATAPAANTGSGGGAGTHGRASTAGAAGIVVIRYPK